MKSLTELAQFGDLTPNDMWCITIVLAQAVLFKALKKPSDLMLMAQDLAQGDFSNESPTIDIPNAIKRSASCLNPGPGLSPETEQYLQGLDGIPTIQARSLLKVILAFGVSF